MEVPADRAVHLAAGLQDGPRAGSALVPPGPEPPCFDYVATADGGARFGPRPPRPQG